MTKHADLIKEMEAATVGSRELDAKIALAILTPPETGKDPFDWKYKGNGEWQRPAMDAIHPGLFWSAPRCTTSIDAANSLRDKEKYIVSIFIVEDSVLVGFHDGKSVIQSVANTEPLARSAAALRAMEEDK